MTAVIGRLDYDIACAKCGEPVSVDAQGKILCYKCGGFVDGSVPMEQIKQVRRPKNVQLPLIKNGWGLWNE